ncbi:MAG: S49 family peptidase [Planctomycetota bacterium]
MSKQGSLSLVPHIDQYFGVWAMYEPTFQSLFDRAMSIDISSHMASDHVQAIIREVNESSEGGANGEYRTSVRQNVAVIEASGTLMKHASSFSGGTSTTRLRRSINAAVRDEAVGSVLLSIDSPGGTAAGTFELAETIAKANETKPVLAHIQDMGASAAYWTASAARSISINQPGKVGSIGTYAVVHDLSALAAKEGVKVHVVRAGSEHKGAGIPGTEITSTQLAEFQRLVDQVNGFFLDGVSKGRSMDSGKVKELADGRVHIGSDAQTLGLVDHVRSFEETFEEAAALASPKTQFRGTAMSATSKEIKAACPGIDAETVLSYLESEKSLDQCKDAWMQELALKAETATEAAEKAEADKAEAVKRAEEAASAPGVDPLVDEGGTTTTENSANDAFWAAVKEHEANGKNRIEALAAVNRRNPELRKAMVAEGRELAKHADRN